MKKSKVPDIDIGLKSGERKKIVVGLSALLADSYSLYLMTHNFHWNVTGPQFNSAASDVHDAVHRAMGRARPHRGAHSRAGISGAGNIQGVCRKLTSIRGDRGVPTADEMVRHLVAAQEATARTARNSFPVVNASNDQPTADLLTQRLEVHEKTAWMLRSTPGRLRHTRFTSEAIP